MYIYICPTQFMNSQFYNFTDIRYICLDLWTLSPGALAVMATGTPRANPPLGATSAGRWRDISEHQDKQGNPCCPVALQWGKACWRKMGDRHKKMRNLQSWVNGTSCLGEQPGPCRKLWPGGGRGEESSVCCRSEALYSGSTAETPPWW